MRREFQANAFFTANGVTVKMVSNATNKTILVETKVLKGDVEIDREVFNYEDPADVAAAFAKYSNAVTWAVTHEEDSSNVSANGM